MFWKLLESIGQRFIMSLFKANTILITISIIFSCILVLKSLRRPLGYEKVYLPLCKMADTLFHIQGDEKITEL